MAERYAFGWSDYRGLFAPPRVRIKNIPDQVYDMTPDWVASLVGTCLIMIPVTIIALSVWNVLH